MLEPSHQGARSAPAGHGGSCLGGAKSTQVTADVRHWWGDVRDGRANGRPGRVTARKVRNGHRADHCGAAGRQGLKSGALGLVSTTIIATASVAPAYSIAA